MAKLSYGREAVTNLAGSFDSFEQTGDHDHPRYEKTQREVPFDPIQVFDTATDVQHSAPGRKRRGA